MATIPVHSGDDLQAAINSAVGGDVLVLDDGATWTGNFTLPVHSGSSAITIQPVTVPPAATRVSPASAVNFPKLQSGNSGSCLATAAGAHDWTIIGIEFKPNGTNTGDIIELGDGSSAQNTLSQVPYNLTIDRCYIHGDATVGQKRGIALNSGNTTIQYCYLSDFKLIGQDTQAICGWNGPGPYLIDNNYLEAAAENVLFGGALTYIPQNIPSDITFTNNDCVKPTAWRSQSWQVKNLFEIKAAQRVIVDSNRFMYVWQAAQDGWAIQFTVRNSLDSSANNYWNTIANVTFSRNVIAHASSGINILGHEDTGVPSGTLTNLTIRDNVFYDISNVNWGGAAHTLQLQYGDQIIVNHNTFIVDEPFDDGTVIYLVEHPITNFVCTNNIFVNPTGADNVWVRVGGGPSGGALGTAALDAMAAPWTFTSNVNIGGSATGYPTGNLYPATISAVGFTNAPGNDYRLLASSPYHNAGTDGMDIGARFANAPAPGSNPPPPPPPDPPGTPSNPVPADSATNVSTATSLAWNLTSNTTAYNVDFGTVNPPPNVVTGQTGTSYTPTLSASTVYYWKITATGPGGSTAGPVWTFTTAAAPAPPSPPPTPPPSAPSLPTPTDGATNVCPHASVSWTGNGASSFDVALGTTNPPPTVSVGQTASAYTPAPALAWSTTYCWQITAINSGGRTDGPVWSFTTAAIPTGIILFEGVMGTLLPWVKPTFVDPRDNKPADGARLYFYEAGTSTLLATFSDPNLTIPNTNPVLLNSAGQIATQVFVQPTGYTVTLVAKDGVQLWSEPFVEAINGTPPS